MVIYRNLPTYNPPKSPRTHSMSLDLIETATAQRKEMSSKYFVSPSLIICLEMPLVFKVTLLGL